MDQLDHDIVQDLLPLYHDGVCSDKSRAAVEEHLQTCQDCRKALEEMDTQLPTEKVAVDDAAAVKNIKPLYAEDNGLFDSCKAWQEGKVYLQMAYNAYYTNYEIALANAWFSAKCVYPEQFTDIDMTEKLNEITGAFLGKGIAEEIYRMPNSFGGYQQIDTATFFS